MRLYLPAFLLALCTSTLATTSSVPATVVVAFNRTSVLPVIVEGAADRATGRQVSANDPVRIASISKLIMALATLRLVDEGRVALNVDVSDYLGWSLRSPYYPNTPVTLAQLLSHRAGLRDDVGYVVALGESLQDKLKGPQAWYAGAPPGEAPFEYANLGSPIVATVLEAATGERYDALVERTVFSPLGIEACLNWLRCNSKLQQHAVVLYRYGGDVARDNADDLPPNCTIPLADGVDCDLSRYRPGENASVFSPQGGVRMGMADLAKLGQALLNLEQNEFLSPSSRTLLFETGLHHHRAQSFFCAYGLGIQKIEASGSECEDRLMDDGVARWGHAGEAYGLRAGIWLSPQTGQGVAYFTTAVPDRLGSEDEGGFDDREISLMKRAAQ